MLPERARPAALGTWPVVAEEDAVEELCRISMRHAYQDDGEAVLAKVLLLSPASGLRLGRDRAGVFHVAADRRLPPGGRLRLAVTATDAEFLALTAFGGQWAPGKPMRTEVGPEDGIVSVDAGRVLEEDLSGSAIFARVFGVLDVTLPDRGVLQVDLRFDVVAPHWEYVVSGVEAVSVEDMDEEVTFRRMPDRELPNGATALVFRSDGPLPLRKRDDRKFCLKQVLKDGSAQLVRLPVASVRGLRPDPAGGPGALTADIFVML